MKVMSDATLVTRSDGERVRHAPGTVVDLPKEEAEDKIARGLVYPAKPVKEDPPETEPVNVNEADATTLATIKGVGKKTAGDIVASREADGPFQSLEDCAERVGGVSLEQLEAAEATV